MKKLLLFTVLGLTTLLSAASMSNINSNEEVRQKRDNQPQRTRQYQEKQRQPQRQINSREFNQKQFNQRDTQRVEAKKTIRMQEQPQRSRQHLDQKRQTTQPVYRNGLQRQPKKSSVRTQEQQRRISQRVNQRDSIQRTFRTHKEFNRVRPHLRANYYNTYERRDYRRHYNIRQSGLLYFINSWYFIYQDRHAPFYDKYGYFYGFFNQYGYYFEGIFYSYDRYYTYEDRLRGKGLFDNRYYEPYLQDGYDDWYDSYQDPYYN